MSLPQTERNKILKQKLIRINKRYSDGSIRYDACLEDIGDKNILQIAEIVAEQHPFTDGNKRTAIRFCEWNFHKTVPSFVYKILEKA